MAKALLEVDVDAEKLVALLKALPHEERMRFVELLLKEPALEDVVEEIEDILDMERLMREKDELLPLEEARKQLERGEKKG